VIAFAPSTDLPLLVVDDDEPLRKSIARQLERRGYTVVMAGNCLEAKTALAEQPFALVLCDIDLPGQSGLSLVEALAVTYPDTAVVMVTGLDDPRVAQVAIDAGAYGYLIKPVEANELVINVSNALRRRTLEVERRVQTEQLECLVGQRTTQLRRSHEELIQRLMCAADYRDPETATHLQRMSRYSALLARLVGESRERCELIRLAAPMHDIGKIGIPDEILRNPGSFTDADREAMKEHTRMGFEILHGSESPLIQLAAEIAYTHHEWWDGSGYPRGLSGADIPLVGRIVAIGDVFDALCTQRRYKPAMTMDEAIAIMGRERSRHFDPDLLDLFFTATAEIEEIKRSYSEVPPAG
jgi:putative two-component system response regulator